MIGFCSYHGLLQVDGNLRTEPKHIVFLSQLLLLFNFCHSCKADNLLVKAKAIGTEAVVTTICNNPKCPQRTMVWHSQPRMPGRKVAAGNFLLCMAVLFAGGSYTKLRQIFQHMGVGCVSHKTYFLYQRVSTFIIGGETLHVYTISNSSNDSHGNQYVNIL